MNLTDVPGDPGRKQKRKRIGRGPGSGQGKTSGKGHKGAKARAGSPTPRGFEGGQTPFHRRVPKRGFNNIFRREYVPINVSQLEAFDAGAEITPSLLYEKKLARPKGAPIKVLGQGELSKKLTVRANAFSASARQKIEAAGGVAEVI